MKNEFDVQHFMGSKKLVATITRDDLQKRTTSIAAEVLKVMGKVKVLFGKELNASCGIFRTL